ncbi:superkiller complex protein 2-like [Corticium candelabrum]|uniref:superkiller complex protein 2-like n=1 Tax=Corticium candelabrum TaxID=121492 RepID=UPI002E267C48|nr:superkiller complex protein 2-like [Corticium candelabrum]
MLQDQLEKAEKSDVKFDARLLGCSFRLVETGAAGGVQLVEGEYSRDTLDKPFSTLPCGMPPVIGGDRKSSLERFLLQPEKLPIHDPKRSHKFWPREIDYTSLYHIDVTTSHTTLSVERDKKTGKLLKYTEVNIPNPDSSAHTSTSLSRPPGLISDSIKGLSSNIPFWPGGLDEPDLSVSVGAEAEDIDFENDLLTCPPGFAAGIEIEQKKKPAVIARQIVNVAQLNLDDVLAEEFTLDTLAPSDEENESEEDEREVVAANENLHRSESLENILPKISNETTTTKSQQTTKPNWVININTTEPVNNFHKLIPHMAYEWPFELDIFQKQAILCLERGDCVFVAAHTSAGKTVVAEYAIALSTKHMTKTIYTSPIKALSNQKFRDFRMSFGDVGLVTGDVQIKPDAACLIMTTEILRSMLYNGSDVIRDVEWVIFDEVHYINDTERGVVWEEVLIMLPDHVNIVLLSATVPNTYEFADWIGHTKQKPIYVISTAKRPVPLEHYLYTGNSSKTCDELFLLVDADGRFLTKGYQRAVDAKKARETKSSAGFGTKGPLHGGNFKQDKNIFLSLINKLKKDDRLPVVAFTFSRKRCDENASGLTTIDMTTSAEKSEITVFFSKSVARLKGTDKQLPQVLRLKELLARGIGVHHSGILPIMKEVIEMLFQRGLVKLLFATETFAMGVNMPARTVVFDSTRKHDGTALRNLLSGEYIQMAGRAGRRGLDSTGTVILLCKGDVPETSELHQMMLGRPTKLESKFRLTYSMILNLLRVEQLRVEDMMKRSFAELDLQRDAQQASSQRQELEQQIKDFQEKTFPMCDDIEEYYFAASELNELKHSLQSQITNSPQAAKLLSSGRIIVINNQHHNNTLAVLLQPSTSRSRLTTSVSDTSKSYTVLILCNEKQRDVTSQQPTTHASHYTPSTPAVISGRTPLFCPDGPCGHVVVDVKPIEIAVITDRMLRVNASYIIDDYRKRQQTRFRDNPPGRECSIATQELLRLVETNPDGLEAIDPVKDLNMRDIDFIEKFRRSQFLEQSLQTFQCVHSPHFVEAFEQTRRKQKMLESLNRLKFLLSDESLQLLPEYRQRVEVLKRLAFIDVDTNVQLKGRVACEISNHELFITELVFENILRDLDPTEIVAILSCFVFQQKHTSEPQLTETLQNTKDQVIDLATRLAGVQMECDLQITVEEFVGELHFGLVEAVYEWARGMPFSEITNLTDVQEGIIVRCIQRLDEVCRDVRTIARMVGDPVLYEKMDQGSSLIKRDIVFAASLYTQ